ncbi:MAG: 1,4-dihydroxy-2-naphthoate polyprenyltransferase [bacterium]|nr:1,4-dihydroxy-2-naphthoate polyprenyltransferase [bacterium]
MLKTWLMAIRPKTLPAAAVPVVMGTAIAYADGLFHFLAAFAALLGALLIQVGTNLVNDYADFNKGTDDETRIGPVRVTQAGLVSPGQMKRAIWFTFGLAVLVSLYLIYRGGWPVVVIGVLSILSGVLYTAGPLPLGYIGLGDVFVLIFFGPVALGGSYYVQALTINWLVVLAGFGPGLISVAILAVNNLRDVEGDGRSGKRTLAVRFGKTFARFEYLGSIIVACLIPVVIYVVTGKYGWAMVSCLSPLVCLGVIGTVFRSSDGPALNAALAGTGKILLIYGILFSVGWILST